MHIRIKFSEGSIVYEAFARSNILHPLVIKCRRGQSNPWKCTIDLDHGQGFQIAANSAENMTITHSSDCDWVVWYQDNDECDLGPIDKPDDMEDVMTFSIVCSELAEEGSYNFTMYCVDIEGNVLNSTDVPYVVKYPWS